MIYNDGVWFEGKRVVFKKHLIQRARLRGIVFPDQVYACIRQGAIGRLGRREIRFTLPTKRGTIICIAEERGEWLVVKTVAWGN